MRPNDRPRILFLAHEFTWGGAALLAVRHMERLSSRCSVDLLIAGPVEERMLGKVPGTVSIFSIDPSAINPDDAVPGGVKLSLLHRGLAPFRTCYDALLATSIFPSWAACAAFRLVQADRKIIFLVDEGLAVSLRASPIAEALIGAALRSANYFLPVSQRLWDRMVAKRPVLQGKAFEVLRPPLPMEEMVTQKSLPRPVGWGSDLPVVLTVARLSPEKQLLQCLKVHRRLRDEGVDFRWFVVGSGPEEPVLRSEIQRLGMDDRFLLAGDQNEVYSWMRHCDAFALLSLAEGCPTVVLEALTMGRPVIMTDVNGADELLRDGETGLIVDNNQDAIAGGLLRMIAEPGLRDRMALRLALESPVSDPEIETARLLEHIRAPLPPALEVAPQVSILIPTYRQGGLVERAMASAVLQDAENFEIVVGDDASPDLTSENLASWQADARIRWVRNASNLGRSANYRKLLTEHARGEWVLMLDGDDYLWDPGFVRTALEHLRNIEGDKPLFLQAGHRIEFKNAPGRGIDVLPKINGKTRLMAPGKYLEFVFESGFFSHLGTIYQRQKAVEFGFYEKDISSSDLDSLLRFSLHGNVLVHNAIAGCWYYHDANASRSVPLGRIVENLTPLADAANEAVRRGLADKDQLQPKLESYQRVILKHLIETSLSKWGSPREILYALKIVWEFDPKLVFNRAHARRCDFNLRKILLSPLRSWLFQLRRRCTP